MRLDLGRAGYWEEEVGRQCVWLAGVMLEVSPGHGSDLSRKKPAVENLGPDLARLLGLEFNPKTGPPAENRAGSRARPLP